MKKIKYLTPILGLTAMVGVAAPIATSCAKATKSTTLPYNLLKIDGVTLRGLVAGADLTQYDTIVIPEGVKYIEESAFDNDVVEEGKEVDYSTIKTLKLPASVRSIGDYAFYSMTKLTNIDLTSWDNDTIHYVEIEDDGFEFELEDNNLKSCKVNLADGLSMGQEETVKTKLTDACIPDWWFIDQTTGHIAATEGVAMAADAVMTNSTGEYYFTKEDEFSLTLTDTFDTGKYKIELWPQTTATVTENEKIDYEECTYAQPTDFKTVKFGIASTTNDEWVAADKHDINFDVNVICRRIDDESNKVMWTEKVEGFKITNKYTHVTSVEIDPTLDYGAIWLHADATTPTYPEEDQPKVTVLPENCVNNLTHWVSSDESIIKIETEGEKEGWGRCIKPGYADLTVVADDNGESDSIPVIVPGIACAKGLTCGDPDETHTALHHTNMIGSRFGQDGESGLYYGYTIPEEHDLLFKIEITDDTAFDAIKESTTDKYRSFQVRQAVAQGGSYDEKLIAPIGAQFYYYDAAADETKQLALGTDFTIEYNCVAIKDSTAAGQAVKFGTGDILYINFEFAEDAAGLENTGLMFDLAE